MSWDILCVGSIAMHKTKFFADLISLGAPRKIILTLGSFLDFFHSQHALDVKKTKTNQRRVCPLLLSDPLASEGGSWADSSGHSGAVYSVRPFNDTT